MKCSDIGNVAAVDSVSDEWCRRANLEFFHQGDLERSMGSNPAPFLDRFSISPEQNTLNFIDFIAQPLFYTLSDLLPSTKRCWIEHVEKNRKKLADTCRKQKEQAAAVSAIAEPIEQVKARHQTGKNAFPTEQMKEQDTKRCTLTIKQNNEK